MIALRLPDFIIAGAPRCGTTWLYHVADRHPAIMMAKPVVPEPKFFLRDDLFGRGLAYYSQCWFAGIPTDRLAGEKSANYLESPEAAERISQCLPDVRLIFLLRNPVERAFSNYLWSRQNSLEAASFAEALEQEDERESTVPDNLRYARPHALFSRGLYADMLLPYFARFRRERVLVLRYEDIRDIPAGVAEQLHRFLGVEVQAGGCGRTAAGQRGTQPGRAEFDPALYRRLVARYSEPNRRLRALLGTDFPLWEFRSDE